MNTLCARTLSPYVIEPYREAFREEIGSLITTIQQKEFNVPITLADQPDLNNIPAAYQQGDGNFWVALEGNDVIGTIALIDVGEKVGVIRKMFVRKDQRGSGVAQELFDILMAWSKSHGFRDLYLGTIDRLKAAQRFYERNGFSMIANSDLPASVEKIRMKVDTMHYHKRLLCN